MARKRQRIALPRPRGTRATSRVELLVSMHPRKLAQLVERAKGASMSLTAYVGALLDSDADDVAPAGGFSAREVASPAALMAAGMRRGAPAEVAGQVVEVVAQSAARIAAADRAERLSNALDAALDAAEPEGVHLPPTAKGAELLAAIVDAHVDVEQLAGRAKKARRVAARAGKKGGR